MPAITDSEIRSASLPSMPSTAHSRLEPAKIPLPFEVPPPPNLANVPPRILHSATIETLIDHTDDLSSRLKVHIRRNGQLEGQIVELEERIQDLEIQRQTTLAQIEILREKDKAVYEKQLAIESKLNRATDDLQLAKTETRTLTERNMELANVLVRQSTYRRRVQRWVQPGIAERKRALVHLQKRSVLTDDEVSRLNSVLSQLRDELTYVKSESDRKIAAIERDRARLVDHYEKSLTKLSDEKKQALAELQRALEQVTALDQSNRDSARANNERVFFERRAEELDTQLRSETQRLQQALDDLAVECATLRASVQTSRELKAQADLARQESENSRLRAESQLQGLREVWQETSLRLQSLESKNEALEKINAELSRKLTESRDKERIRLSDEALNRVGFTDSKSSSHASADRTRELQESKLKKLDSLLTDMEMKAFGIDPKALKISQGDGPESTT